MNKTVLSNKYLGISYSGSKSHQLNLTEKFFTLLVFLYWLVYENVIFFYSMEYGGAALFFLTNGIKLILPITLLIYSGLPSSRLFTRGKIGLYVFFFALFLLWGIVPTLISGDLFSWFKLLPRLVFFLAVIAFFMKRPSAFELFSKCLIIYVLFALLQYFFIYITGAYDNPIGFQNQKMAGPYGLFGNIVSMMYFPGAPFPFIRLTGFWNEPSNASASAFLGFFLCRYLTSVGAGEFWRKSTFGCLLAGILALSNAGYLAFGTALVFGFFFSAAKFTARRAFQFAMLLPIALICLFVALFGRIYVAENLHNNYWARAIVGLRDVNDQYLDPSSGRLELVHMTLNKTAERIIGLGIQEVGSEGIEGSASAPLLWLLLTGIPGLFLLICREIVLLLSIHAALQRLPSILPLAQALVVVMTQHLVYGTWMNPNYFILAAMILVCSYRVTQQSSIPNRLKP